MHIPPFRQALASAVLLAAGLTTQAEAQTPSAPPDTTRPPITEDMVRRVGAPPRPNAELRIEVQPGTVPQDERKAKRPKAKKSEPRP